MTQSKYAEKCLLNQDQQIEICAVSTLCKMRAEKKNIDEASWP